MVSVSVCSCSSHFLSLPHKQTQQQYHQHLHLAESTSGSSRAAADAWVQGLPNKHMVQPACIVGLDPDRKALFTAVVSRQATACKESAHVSTDTTVCLGAAAEGRRLLASSTDCTRQSCGSAGNQASMLLCWLPQQPKWPAVPSSCSTFVTGCSTQQLLRPTLVTGGTGSCAGAPSYSGSRHVLPSARKSVEAVRTLLWLMEMQSSAAADARVTPAHLQCHCGGSLGTAVRYVTQMSLAQAKLCCACKTAMDGMPLPLLGNTYLC